MEDEAGLRTREATWAAAKAWLLKELNPEPAPHSDPCSYLCSVMQVNGVLNEFENWVKQVHVECASKNPGAQAWMHQIAIPARPRQGVSRHLLLVTQLAFEGKSCPRGPPGAADVLEICDRNFLSQDGNMTEKYPLEVLFDKNNPGGVLESWSVQMSIGFGTAISCVLGLWAFCNYQKWLPGLTMAANTAEAAEVQLTYSAMIEAFGPWLLKAIRLHGVWDPPSDTWSLVQKSLGGKIQAASRQRPNPAQMFSALGLLVQEAAGQQQRKPLAAVWDGVIATYNKAEKVKTCKLQGDEIQAIKLFAKSSDEFRVMVRRIWGTDKLGCTSIPLSLISAKFLDASTELPVDQKSNPLFFGIFQVTEEKKLLFVERCDGRFNERVLISAKEWGFYSPVLLLIS